MEKRPIENYASIEDFETAFQALSLTDILRIDAIARDLVKNSSIISPETLIEKTLKSILLGKRKWPQDVDIIIFIRNALRSHVSGYWKRQDKLVEQIKIDKKSRPNDSPETVLLASEHDELVQKRYDEIIALFDGHHIIEAILLGREENRTASEIRDQYDISKRDYDSALKYMRRTLSKNFPDGWLTW